MTFIDMMITRRHFAARYRNLGRPMIADLADIYALDRDVAEQWADEIDREIQQCAGALPHGSGEQGGGGVQAPLAPSPPALPSGTPGGAR